MFTRKLINDHPLLDEEIDRALTHLKTIDPSDKHYFEVVDHISKLYALRPEQPKPVSPDTMAMIAGNLAGIVLIVGYERANIVTSKALGFVLKLR